MTEKTTTGRLVAAGGGLLLIISLFLSWYGVEVGGAAGQFAAAGAFDTSANGWQSLDIGDLVFFIVGLLAIAPAALDIFDLEVELPFDIGFVALVGGGISIAWIVLRIIDKPGPDIPDVAGVDIGIGLKIGIFLALVGAIAITIGGYLQQQEDDGAVAAGYDPNAYAQTPPAAAPPAAAPPAAAPPAAAPPAQAPPAQAPPAQAPPAQAPPAQAPPAPQPPAPEQPPQPPQPPAV